MYDIEIPAQASRKNGYELDVMDHRRDYVWQRGEVRKVKAGINRRGRRQTRQALRAVRS